MNGFGLFGFSGTFSSLLYCRLTVCWIYCIFILFFFSLRERWHLLQYCDDYLNCKLYRVHNCSLFSVGNPYKIVFSDHFFLFLFCFCFVFFPWLWKIKLYSSRVYPPPSALFFFYFLEPMIKRNLKTVNKYYCAEIWMSLQKCIWMS